MLKTIKEISVGQKWYAAGNPSCIVDIVDIVCWDKENPNELISYDIYYQFDNGSIEDKDGFNFQVRYAKHD